MTDRKLVKWLNQYEEILRERESQRHVDNDLVAHMLTMIPQMRVFIAEGRREKLMRWIGFIQGSLWVMGAFSIEELKQHNMPDEQT